MPATWRRVGAIALSAQFAVLAVNVGLKAPAFAAPTAPAVSARNDYAVRAFDASLSAGLRAFYLRDFSAARRSFELALTVVPDNTLALSFLNATAMQTPGDLDALIDSEEDALGKRPGDYLTHVRLGFSYLFASQGGRDRDADAREELNAAVGLRPGAQAAHVGLGILRASERSTNRAKVEFLTALRVDENNVLAREYVALMYQADLRDPQRGLGYVINIPNLVPDYADIYYHIASLFDDLGQSDAAVKYATSGLEKDLGHVGEAGRHGYTLLARIYLNEKKTGDARRVLRASLAANVDTALAATLLRKLDRGDSNPRTSSPAPKVER